MRRQVFAQINTVHWWLQSSMRVTIMQLLFDVEYCNSCWVPTVIVFLEAKKQFILFMFRSYLLLFFFQTLLKFNLESFREVGIFQVSSGILRKPEFLHRSGIFWMGIDLDSFNFLITLVQFKILGRGVLTFWAMLYSLSSGRSDLMPTIKTQLNKTVQK